MASVATVGAEHARKKGYPGQKGGLSKRPLAFPANQNRNPVGPKIPLVGKIGAPVPGALGGLTRAAGRIAFRAVPYVGTALTAWDIYKIMQGGQPGVGTTLELNGWQHIKSCAWSTGTPLQYTFVAASPGAFNLTTCWTGQQGLTPITARGSAVPSSHTGLVWVYRYTNFGTRYSSDESFYRASASQTTGVPEFVANPDIPPYVLPVLPMPDILPSIDPLSLPVGAPQPFPATMPVRALPGQRSNPNRSPVEQHHYGNALPNFARSPSPQLPPTVAIVPVAPPSPPRGPGGGGKPPRKPKWLRVMRSNRFRKRRKENDRKVAAKSKAGKAAMALASGALNLVTEIKDVVDVLHAALPAHLRRGDRGLTQKTKSVLAHRDEIDWNKALPGLVKNEIEDRLMGKAERLKRRAARKANLSRDYSLGAGQNGMPTIPW